MTHLVTHWRQRCRPIGSARCAAARHGWQLWQATIPKHPALCMHGGPGDTCPTEHTPLGHTSQRLLLSINATPGLML